MTGSHTSTPQRSHPPATPWRTGLLRRRPEVSVLLILLGLFMWTTRLALRERSAGGVWAAITLWVVMGVPAALDRYDRAEAAGAYVFSGQRPGRRLGTGGRSASTPPSTPATGNTAGRPA